MVLKRYQTYGPKGLQWTDWFPYNGPQYKHQLGNKLLNEYKEQ